MIGTRDHGILISNDHGRHWRSSESPFTKNPVRALLSSKGYILAGTDNGIERSVDGGHSWTRVFQGTQTNSFTETHNKIYAALANGAVMSATNGVTWNYIYTEDALHAIAHDAIQFVLLLFHKCRHSQWWR